MLQRTVKLILPEDALDKLLPDASGYPEKAEVNRPTASKSSKKQKRQNVLGSIEDQALSLS
jgi:hypothetical protein